MIRNRILSNILGKDPWPVAKKITRKRAKVQCYCDKCKGKSVDPRTKERHELANRANRKISSQQEEVHEDINIDEMSHLSLTEQFEVLIRDVERSVNIEENQNIMDDNTYDDTAFDFLSRKRISRYTKLSANFDVNDFDQSESEQRTDNSHDSDDSANNEQSEIFEDYSYPPLEQFQDANISHSTHNNQFLWILLWIMNFRKRFYIPETATEFLIKFMKLVLTEIGGEDFDDFPKSIYLARNMLSLKDQFQTFVLCPKCHKLYEKHEVENYCQGVTPAVMKFRHVEFSNSSRRQLQLCQAPLSQQAKSLDGLITNRPELIYLFSGIKNQLTTMFHRPGFESSLRHWTNRSNFDNILTDIYDGKVWKTFKDDDSTIFFQGEVADSHLGLMLNLDWFQPYDGTMHSTGAIYAAICNLPCDIRFWRENLLLLGLLPGPNEVSLHKINHYLVPIVNELQSLWNGVTLHINECPNGKRVRAALILVTCDIPATRKICGHISALVSCYRCEKKANYEKEKHNFASMSNMNDWFISKNLKQHHQDAVGW